MNNNGFERARSRATAAAMQPRLNIHNVPLSRSLLAKSEHCACVCMGERVFAWPRDSTCGEAFQCARQKKEKEEERRSGRLRTRGLTCTWTVAQF